MKRSQVVILAIIVAVAAIIAASAFVLSNQDIGPKGPFTITYNLQGGENDPDNPVSYMYGDSIALFPATREDMVFGGWYLDEEYHEICISITPKMRSDITLHALWLPDGSGTSLTYAVSGYSEDGIRTTRFSGTETDVLAFYDPETLSYFTGEHREISYTTYQFNKVIAQWTDVEDVSRWSRSDIGSSSFKEREVIETETFGKVECDVISVEYSDGTTETRWIGIDGLRTTYRIVVDSDDGLKRMDLTGIGEATIPEKVDVKVIGGYGIVASSDGTDAPGKKMGLTAEIIGDVGFKGWFDSEGNLVSKDPVCSITVLLSPMTLYALNDRDYDFTATTEEEVTLSVGMPLAKGTFWNVRNETSGYNYGRIIGSEPSVLLDRPGYHTVEVTGEYLGEEYKWILHGTVSGEIVKKYSWKFNDELHIQTVKVQYDDYLRYVESTPVEMRRYCEDSLGDNDRNRAWVTYEDPYVKELAQSLHSKAESRGMSGSEEANYILKFVQSIPYKSDMESYGVEEYWKYPVETLFDGFGDCEDTSILYCAIMKAIGFETALLVFEDDIASGVEVDDLVFGTKYKNRFYHCETNGDWLVGQKPVDTGLLKTLVPIR